MPSPDRSRDGPQNSASGDPSIEREELIDLLDIFTRLGRGSAQILGFALLGAVAGGAAYLALGRSALVSTSVSIMFPSSHPGRGEYFDHISFNPGDMKSPPIVAEAIRRKGLDQSGDFQRKISAAFDIEPVVPSALARARALTAGQTPPTYIPDEYVVSLSLPRNSPPSIEERGLLLNEIVSVYQEQAQRIQASIPLPVGNLVEVLAHTDADDYGEVINAEVQSLTACLSQLNAEAPVFRSQKTNLSFSDLLRECQIFGQTYVSKTLKLIRLANAAATSRTALSKMDNDLQALADQEREAIEEQKTFREFLDEAEANIKGPDATYDFAFRKALDAGIRVNGLQSDEARILGQRKRIEAAVSSDSRTEFTQKREVDLSLQPLETAYQKMVIDIRNTYADYARGRIIDAVHIESMATSSGVLWPLVTAGIVGLSLGLAGGIGMSLLRIYVGEWKR